MYLCCLNNNKMTQIQTIQHHLEQMQLLTLQLAGNEGQRNDIIQNGAKFGYKPSEISGMIQDLKLVEADLIKQYRKHSQEQFRLLREYEVRNSNAINIQSATGAIFSHTSHNSEMAKYMEQL